MFVCDNCEEANTEMKRCGDCLTVRYCNQTCQLAHWSVHQQNCKPKSLEISTLSNGSVTSDTVTNINNSVISDVTINVNKTTTSTSSDSTIIKDEVKSVVTKPEESVTSDATDPTKTTTTPLSPTNPNTVVVSPVFDDPANPGFGILNSSTPRQLVNFQTGRTYQLDKEAMLERYKGVEEEMTLKIQVPWTEQGLPCTDRELWVYNQSRDFTFCVLPGDPNCGVIRDKILAEGLSCIRPGKKLYFRARLSEEFLLHVQLDSTVDAKW